MKPDGPVRAWESSAPGRGGVSIIGLQAPTASTLDEVLASIAGGGPFDVASLHHRRLANIDDGIVARITSTHAQLMPHGGPAIVRRIRTVLAAQGVEWCSKPPAGVRPESTDPLEALALDAISVAASPAAIPLLLRQARRRLTDDVPSSKEETIIGRRLDRLITPVSIACVGAPNAGKSSLFNALYRTPVAMVSSTPGTTRDRVSALLDLNGVVIEWIDTPGLRESDDPIERAAIKASLSSIREATLIIHLTAPDVANAVLPDDLDPPEGILSVQNKVDLLGSTEVPAGQITVSAKRGTGILELAQMIRRRIVRDADLNFNGRWRFQANGSGAAQDGDQTPTVE